MEKHGKSTMYVHWSRAWSGYHVRNTIVVLSQYHPRIHRWLPLSSQWLSATAHYTRFRSLQHRRHYRVYVQFHNGWGYSLFSMLRYVTIGK